MGLRRWGEDLTLGFPDPIPQRPNSVVSWAKQKGLVARICTSTKPPRGANAAGLWPTLGISPVSVEKMKEDEGRPQDEHRAPEVGVGM